MKKFTLLILSLLLSVMGVNAKEKTTTLWEGTSTDDAEINLPKEKFSTAKAGDVIRITFSFTSAGSLHLCYKTGVNNDWDAKAFNGISEWPNYSDTSVTSADFSINATDLTTLQTYGMYIYGFTSSTITKIELITAIQPTSTGNNLLNENWVVNTDNWENKNFAAQASAKIGDVILFNITVASGWKYTEVQVKDSEGNDFENNSSYKGNFANETNETFEYEINNAKDLEKIQSAGFRVNASNHATITSINLLSYADSYDAVSITVGSDGIATYSNTNKNVQISACDALKAYYASDVNTGIVTLTELTCIPASQGAIVKGTAGTYTVKVGGDGWEDLTSKNYLKATGDYSANVTASAGSTFHYIFAKKKTGDASTIGFYKLTAAHTLAAHKAYLETSTDITPASNAPLMLDFGGGTTAIMDVFQDEMKQQLAQEDNVYYTLQGTRVQNPTKGLYILNGKKIIVK